MINDILDDTEKLIFVIMCLFILFELIAAFVFFNKTKNFIANSRLVRTKIVKLEKVGQFTKAYLSFKDPLGKTVDASLTVAPNKYEINQDLEVLSHKENPAEVELSSTISLWFLPGAMIHSAIVTGVVLGIMVSMDIAELPF